MLVLREYHTKLGVLINKFEGTVERFSGDGLLVVFNDPLVPIHQYVPCRWRSKCAMRLRSSQSSGVILGTTSALALALPRAMQRLEASDTRGGSSIQLRAKVANLASRLCDQANDGQILIDINVFSAVETLADVEFAGELALKGFSRPVKAFNLAFIKYAPPSRKFWGICQRIVIKSCQLNVPGGVALAVSRIGMPLAGFNS